MGSATAFFAFMSLISDSTSAMRRSISERWSSVSCSGAASGAAAAGFCCASATAFSATYSRTPRLFFATAQRRTWDASSASKAARTSAALAPGLGVRATTKDFVLSPSSETQARSIIR